MKKPIFILILAVIVAGTASAQNDYDGYKDPDRFRAKYFNFSFASQKMAYHFSGSGLNADMDMFKSSYGVGLTAGRSYILHNEPILGMIRIGLDATWFDMNYAHQKPAGIFSEIFDMLDAPSFEIHQADISMGIGPSIHVNPVGRLGIHAYARYNPTLATLFNTQGDFSMAGGYSSVIVTGGAISWGVISVGVEGRWGFAKYSDWFTGGDEGSEGTFDKMKLKTKGLRAYIGFRF